MAKRGAPSIEFTQELADRICGRLAEGRSLRSVCGYKDTVSMTTMLKWLRSDEAFALQYARAREIQADVLFDEIHHIADTPKRGFKTTRKGGVVETVEGDMIEHRRLQIDARKWLLGKMAPKKYGDRSTMDVDLSGKIETTSPTDDRLKAALALMMAREAKE